MSEVIYEDTRQKVGKHDVKLKQLNELGFSIVRKKLDYADYCMDDCNIVIDTKQDCEELYMDLFKEHARFRRELIGANENGYKMIILIEDDEISSLSQLKNWKNKRGFASSTELYNRVKKYVFGYNVDFIFCKKHQSGYKIAEIFNNAQYKAK